MRWIWIAAALAVLVQAPCPEALAKAQASNVSITRDVIYGHKAGMALTYDVFRPKQANGTAVVHVVSMGWVSTWTKPEAHIPAYQPLLKRGISVIALYHGSGPKFTVPEAVADVRRGVRHIEAHAAEYGIDPNRIGAWGTSAGGHLALVAGLMADDGDPSAANPTERAGNRLRAIVAFCPPTDMRRFIAFKKRNPALRYDDALAPSISPVLFADAGDPPTLLISGDADRVVDVTHSRAMKAALDRVHVENELVVYPGADHRFEHPDSSKAALYSRDARRRMVAWFVEHL